MTHETHKLLQNIADEAVRKAALEAVRGPGFLDTRELTENYIVRKMAPYTEEALRKMERHIKNGEVNAAPMTYLEFMEAVPWPGEDPEVTDIDIKLLRSAVRRELPDPADQDDYGRLLKVFQKCYGGTKEKAFLDSWVEYEHYLYRYHHPDDEEC